MQRSYKHDLTSQIPPVHLTLSVFHATKYILGLCLTLYLMVVLSVPPRAGCNSNLSGFRGVGGKATADNNNLIIITDTETVKALTHC